MGHSTTGSYWNAWSSLYKTEIASMSKGLEDAACWVSRMSRILKIAPGMFAGGLVIVWPILRDIIRCLAFTMKPRHTHIAKKLDFYPQNGGKKKIYLSPWKFQNYHSAAVCNCLLALIGHHQHGCGCRSWYAECQIVAEHASAARRHGGFFVGRREREHEKKWNEKNQRGRIRFRWSYSDCCSCSFLFLSFNSFLMSSLNWHVRRWSVSGVVCPNGLLSTW